MRIRHTVILAASAFLVHAMTASSGLFWLDSGDFVTAAFDLGVPHPTGYPLHVLLGRLFATLPLGPVPFRLSLLSAALAGVATAFLASILCRLLPRIDKPYLLLACLAACTALWSTRIGGLLGRTPDVYALHLALVGAAVLLCLRLNERYSSADVLLLGLVTGLGMSNHAEFRLFAPWFLAMVVFAPMKEAPRRGWPHRAGLAAGWLAMACVGLLPYLYLPLAASREPYHVWGHPDTVERWWNHVWGLTIRLGHPDAFLNLGRPRLAHAAESFFERISDDWSFFLVLCIWGLVVLLIRRRLRLSLVLLFLLMLTDGAYSIVVNPMGLADDQNGGVSYLSLALLAGAGMAQGLGWCARRLEPVTARLSVVLAWIMAGLLCLAAIGRADGQRLVLNGYWCAEDLTFDGIQKAPTAALVLSDSEWFTAARLYLVGVGALRPDLQVLNRHELSDSLLLAQRSRQGAFPLAPDEVVSQWQVAGIGASEPTFQGRLALLLEQAFASDRAVIWGGGVARDSDGRWSRIRPGFPLHRIHPDGFEGNATLVPPEQIIPAWFSRSLDPWGRRWLADYLNWLGTFYVHRSRPDLALQAWTSASSLAPSWASPLVNLGVLADRRGDLALAEGLATMAAALDPLNATAWMNLARYRCVLGRPSGAREAFENARELGANPEKLEEIRVFMQQCPLP